MWVISKALMNSLCLPEAAVESLVENSSAGQPSAPSSETLTPQAYLSHAKMTEHSRLFRFGMTFALLTEDLGVELLTLYRAAFPVKTCQLPEKVLELAENDLGCGSKWHGLLAKWNHNTSSWKTPQCSLLADSEPSLETFPRWGSMLNGVLWERPPLEHRTKESAFGYLLPTPVASDATCGSVIGKNDIFYTTSKGMPRKINQKGTDGSIGLGRLVQMWPTPTVCGNYNRKGLSATSGDGLATAVKRFPTPTARNAQDCDAERKRKSPSPTSVVNIEEGVHGGKLNPKWVEWLMGWPLGWTDLKPLETDKFRQWQQLHGDC